MTFNDKKKKIIEKLKLIDIFDKEGKNSKRYIDLISKMNEKELGKFIDTLKSGKDQIFVYMNNFEAREDLENAKKLAKKLNVKLFHKLIYKDDTTGITYKTPAEYPVLKLPIRRLQQFLDEKMAVPDGDTKTDMLTGQVIQGNRSSSLTSPEMQMLYGKGLTTTLNELMKVRGGDFYAYAEFKRQLEETGIGSLDVLDPSTRARSATIGNVFLKGMHLDSNM